VLVRVTGVEPARRKTLDPKLKIEKVLNGYSGYCSRSIILSLLISVNICY
jgi:hypothetical protein